MSEADLEAKFRALVEPVLSREQVGRLIELCWGAESAPDVGVIARTAAWVT